MKAISGLAEHVSETGGVACTEDDLRRFGFGENLVFEAVTAAVDGTLPAYACFSISSRPCMAILASLCRTFSSKTPSAALASASACCTMSRSFAKIRAVSTCGFRSTTKTYGPIPSTLGSALLGRPTRDLKLQADMDSRSWAEQQKNINEDLLRRREKAPRSQCFLSIGAQNAILNSTHASNTCFRAYAQQVRQSIAMPITDSARSPRSKRQNISNS